MVLRTTCIQHRQMQLQKVYLVGPHQMQGPSQGPLRLFSIPSEVVSQMQAHFLIRASVRMFVFPELRATWCRHIVYARVLAS